MKYLCGNIKASLLAAGNLFIFSYSIVSYKNHHFERAAISFSFNFIVATKIQTNSYYISDYSLYFNMLTPKTKRNIYRVIPFGVIWLVFSLVYTQLEKGFLGNLPYYPSTGNPYNFSQTIFITPISALVTGLLIGVIEIRYFHKLFMQRSFTKKIIYKSAIYLAIIIFFLLATTVIVNSVDQQTSIFNKAVWNYVWAFFFSYAFFSVGIYMAAIIVVTQFYTEVSENIGHGVLINFFKGKYHVPQEEERILCSLTCDLPPQ
jgi:hypothetical protein